MTFGRLSWKCRPRIPNLQQNQELIKIRKKTLSKPRKPLRLAKARLDAGAGVQLMSSTAQVQLLTRNQTRFASALGYNSSLAEFDRANRCTSTYTESFANLTRAQRNPKPYYTGSGVTRKET